MVLCKKWEMNDPPSSAWKRTILSLACIIHNMLNNALVCPVFLFIMNNPG